MQNSLTHALIDGPGPFAPLTGAADFAAMVTPARLRLVWSADPDAPAKARQDIGAEIDDLLIL